MFRLAAWRQPAALGAGRLAVQMQRAGMARLWYRGDDDVERARCLDRQRWALRLVSSTGASRATLQELRCLAAGDGACEYVVSWQDRARVLSGTGSGLLVAAVLASSGLPAGAPLFWIAVPLVSAGAWVVERWRAAHTEALARAQSGAAFRRWALDASVAHVEPGVVPAQASGVVLELDGDLWRIAYEGTTIRLRLSRGLALLAHLVQNPRQEIHVTTLDAITPSNRPGAARGPSEGFAASSRGDAGEILDAQARAEYRRRATELRAELEEAEARHDASRIEAMRDELEQLEDELRLALGPGGRPRRAANDAERLRVAITHRIRSAIDQIARRHPALGEHLRASVSTGYRCVYDPTAPPLVDEQAARQPERTT
jgi:hypothetical protein